MPCPFPFQFQMTGKKDERESLDSSKAEQCAPSGIGPKLANQAQKMYPICPFGQARPDNHEVIVLSNFSCVSYAHAFLRIYQE